MKDLLCAQTWNWMAFLLQCEGRALVKAHALDLVKRIFTRTAEPIRCRLHVVKQRHSSQRPQGVPLWVLDIVNRQCCSERFDMKYNVDAFYIWAERATEWCTQTLSYTHMKAHTNVHTPKRTNAIMHTGARRRTFTHVYACTNIRTHERLFMFSSI